MLEKITNEEIDFIESLYNPVCAIECLFNDLDNLALFNEERFSHIRLAQLALLSYEYLLDYDSSLSEKENFKLREGAGNVFCFGGRKFGKTLCTEILDLLLSMIHNDADDVGFSSYDALHIRGILEKIIQTLENHLFFKLFEAKINRSPTYRIYLKNGYTLESVNMNLQGENPGAQFYQKHFKRLYLEEASFEPDEVNKKRLDSVSEIGCVYRVAGMTNFTKYSPPGRIFYDLDKRKWLVNFPQYVNPNWDEKEDERATKEHGGKESLSYRIYVKGEIVEDGVSAIDMDRVRKNYDYKRQIKHFEIPKTSFVLFEDILIIERPVNAEYLYIAADIGESAPTEIIIVTEVNKKYQYIYNITLYGLTDKEQFRIFTYLARKLNANYIALDCTEGTGRAIYRSLEEIFPKPNLVWVGFNEKIAVGFETDENNNTIFKDGNPIVREEYTETWSIQRLRDLLYEEDKFRIPLDYKLDTQLNSLIAVQSGNRVLYHCISPENHILSAFRVFFIAQWLNEFANSQPIQSKTFCKTGV